LVEYSIEVPWAIDHGEMISKYNLSAVALFEGSHFTALIPTGNEAHDFYLFDCIAKKNKQGAGVRYTSADATSRIRRSQTQLFLYCCAPQVMLAACSMTANDCFALEQEREADPRVELGFDY
jgi:hypothetical protein